MYSTVIFNGGLGNQLFQYAFMLYLKVVKGYDVKYDDSIYESNNIHDGFQVGELFELGEFEREYKSKSFYIGINKRIRRIWKYGFRIIIGDDQARERQYRYYVGYWQNSFYYESIKRIIEKDTHKIDEKVKNNKWKQELITENAVSVHIRRGDYVNNPGYIDLSSTLYYTKAMEEISQKIQDPIYYFFSDDIEWCKNHFVSDNYRFVEYTGQNAIEDLCLLAQAPNAIIANSSFSWWGAALKRKKNVICPLEDEKNAERYPADWIRISV